MLQIMLRQTAIVFAALTLFAAPAGFSAQQSASPAAPEHSNSRPAPPKAASGTDTAHTANQNSQSPSQSASQTPSGYPGDNPNPQQPQIIVTSPPPAPSEWTWHDRVLWGAYVILAVLGYVGILIAIRILKSIEKHSESASATSKAALGSAAAALLRTQAVVDSERPWIVITVEPFLTMENSFKVMATNRGRTPAQLTATVDQVSVAVDESQLPPEPQFDPTLANSLPAPVILLPGESVGIRPFSRDEVNSICKSSEDLQRIELWEEKIFLFGKVTYRELLSLPGREEHETIWCCRYIHGESKSALVVTGPPAYNHHS